MQRWPALAVLVVLAMSGCVAGDSAPTAARTTSQDDELRAAHERIAQLEAEVAQAEGQSAHDADASSHVTQWQRQAVPGKFQAAGAHSEHADELLFSLADHLVDLRSEDAGVSVTVRVRDNDRNVVGEIVLDGYLDDSTRGHEFRASLRHVGNAWHLTKLIRRQLCWRGGGEDACI